MRIRLPGGIRTTLAVALLLIVGGALGAAYLMVVPALEPRRVDDRHEIGQSSFDTFLITDDDLKIMVRDAFRRRGQKPPNYSE